MSKVQIILILFLFFGVARADSVLSEKGVVTNEDSAIKIAESILVNIYGDKILAQRPFKAKLEGDIWKITGTFHCPKGVGCKGGVARIEINRKDSRVISVTHDK